LFDVCFDTRHASSGYEYFLDYLIITYCGSFGFSDQVEPEVAANEFTKVLSRERLSAYWRANMSEIKAREFTQQSKIIVCGKYQASYRTELVQIFRILDGMFVSTPGPA
jgi:hypothetical protein